MNRKTICLVTNWYPSIENPFKGAFFREQALALKDHFDFIILRYELCGTWVWKPNKIEMIDSESNIRVIKLTVGISLFRNLIYAVIKRVNKRGYNPFQNFVGSVLKALQKEHKFDKLFEKSVDAFYCVSAQTEAYYVQVMAEMAGKPYVISEHGPFPWPNSLLTGATKLAIENADLFLAISYDKVRQIAMQDIKLPKCRYVGNLVDEQLFESNRTPHDVPTFVTVGAYSFYKNYDMLIDVFDKVTERCSKPFRIIVLGYKANRGYSRNAEELEQKMASCLFSRQVEMIPSMPHEEIPGIYNRADAYVMTSIREGRPVAAFEAAGCGLPRTATRCGGVEGGVTNEMGMLSGVGDVDSMVGNICNFLEGRVSFDSNHIREKIVSLFGKESFTQNMTNAFHEVMDSNRK